MPPRFEESLSIAAPKSDPRRDLVRTRYAIPQLKRDISQGPRHAETCCRPLAPITANPSYRKVVAAGGDRLCCWLRSSCDVLYFSGIGNDLKRNLTIKNALGSGWREPPLTTAQKKDSLAGGLFSRHVIV